MNNLKGIFCYAICIFCISGIVLIPGCKSKGPTVTEVIANPTKYAGRQVAWTDVVRDTVEASKDTVLFFFGNNGFCNSILNKPLKRPISANTNITITGTFDSVRTMEVKQNEAIAFQGYLFFLRGADIRAGKKIKDVSNKKDR